jgi:hypothetical protein
VVRRALDLFSPTQDGLQNNCLTDPNIICNVVNIITKVAVSTPRSLDFRRGYDGVEWKFKGSSTVKYTVEV